MQVKPFFYGKSMARIRTIKPEFPQSESMGRVSRESRLCFILLFTLADDAGRLRGNSRMLASLLFPYDDDAKKHIESWLTELEREKCICRYTIDDDQYIQINQWLKHQKIDKPTASKIPPPPDSAESSRMLANPRELSSEDSIKERSKEGNGMDGAKTRFNDFWNAWPKSERKQDKAKCSEKWKAAKLDDLIDVILADIETKKQTQKWQGGFIETPEVYLNNRRWEDGVTPDERKSQPQPKSFAQQEREAGWARWEEQTNRVHPDRIKAQQQSGHIIDVNTEILEILQK